MFVLLLDSLLKLWIGATNRTYKTCFNQEEYCDYYGNEKENAFNYCFNYCFVIASACLC